MVLKSAGIHSSYLTLGEFLNLSELPFAHLKEEDENLTELFGGLTELMYSCARRVQFPRHFSVLSSDSSFSVTRMAGFAASAHASLVFEFQRQHQNNCSRVCLSQCCVPVFPGRVRSGVWHEASPGFSSSCGSETAHLVPPDVGSLTSWKGLCLE